MRHYVHVGTGNYHPTTARLYRDFGLLTCDEQIGADVADMFNQLTGFARPGANGACSSPRSHARRDHRGDRAHDEARRGRALGADRDEDERAGRQALIGRSTARRRPASRSTSTSAASAACARGPRRVGEHPGPLGRRPLPRAFADLRFERGDERDDLVGSADLMPRNLDTRVELLAPVRDEACAARCSTRWSAAWRTTRTPGGRRGRRWTRREPERQRAAQRAGRAVRAFPRAPPRPPRAAS